MTVLAFLVAALAVTVPQQPERSAPAEQQAWRLRGRVVDEQARGIEGACLLIAPESGSTTARALSEPTTRSGADGRFEIDWQRPPADSGRWTSTSCSCRCT